MAEDEIRFKGILYRVEDDRELMVVSRSIRIKIMQENHDILAIGHMDSGPHETSILVERIVGGYQSIHANLLDLPIDEIGLWEEGKFFATNSLTRPQLAIDYNRFSH